MKVPADVRRAYDDGEGSRAAATRLGRDEGVVENFYRFLRMHDVDTLRVIAEECCCELRSVSIARDYETVRRVRDTFLAQEPLSAKRHLSCLPCEYYIVARIPANIHYRSHDELLEIRDYQHKKRLARYERQNASVAGTARSVRGNRATAMYQRISKAVRVANGAG